jgi:arylsulfatase A-like enzyme
LGTPTEASVADSLPARLHEAGYFEAFFGSNTWAGARRQGFSKYFDYDNANPEWDTAPCIDSVADRLPYLCAASSNPLIALPFKFAIRAADLVGVLDANRFADPIRMVAGVDRLTREHRDAPAFIWVHFMPPHDPYAAPSPWLNSFDSSSSATTPVDSHPRFLFEAALESESRTRVLEARYDESVSYIDHYVGQLIAVVRRNLGPNTAILLTADHGERFSHEYGGHGGLMLYEQLLHIPLIVALPGTTQGDSRAELSSQADLAPTIAAIANVAPSKQWEGTSLVEPQTNSEERTIFAMSFEQNVSHAQLANGSVAALRGRWKLVRFIGRSRYPKMPVLQTQLFDVINDPSELRNVASSNVDVVQELSDRIDEKLAQSGGAVRE